MMGTRSPGIIIFLLLFPFLLSAQSFTIRGTVTDAATGESLIGATIVYGENKGVITDMDGVYQFRADAGTYTLKVSYVGYNPQERVITVAGASVVSDFRLKTTVLSEVEVVADVAKTRETPVAFSTVQRREIQEELASRDLPMILNKTPGAYATKQGGGDGDARINIRGFNQRNLAVMIDGIPVNDMENGWVYWSNWFGLDAVTRDFQVQRGLGASKLALPSVGGTLNIVTKGIDSKPGATLRQDIGSDGYWRTSVGVTTGPMKHGWGVTVAASYKQGKGWADQTWTKGWFGYLRVDKKLGDHLLTLSAMGAPQEHAQRSYKQAIATFDKKYAADLGIDTAGVRSYGLKYNPNWGFVNRWEYGTNNEQMYQDNPERLSQSLNYYFKPMFSLRHFWTVSDKFHWSNIIYASIGNGGGTGTATSDKNGVPGSSTFITDQETGLVNFQVYYDQNMKDLNKRSGGILRSSVNNHQWYGLLSTMNWKLSEVFTLSGGIGIRSYKGEHYREVYDLLGGSYFLDNSNRNKDNYQHLFEGDKIIYNYDGQVRWGGLFGMLEFRKGQWSGFLNATAAVSGYQRIDYFRKMDLEIGEQTFTEAVGFGEVFLYNGSEWIVSGPADQTYTSGDTLFVIKPSGQSSDTVYILGPDSYTISSPEASFTRTGWKWFGGFTLKGGVNYNIDDKNNIFINLGYLSKAPRFANVYNSDNKEFLDIRNEIVQAAEIGYSFNSGKIGINVNGYLTYWKNKPVDRVSTVQVGDESYPYNINGIDALHMGIELSMGFKPFPSLQWDRVISVGDWRWASGDSVYIYDDNNNLVDTRYFNAKGVHVGDAAQIQYMESIRWEIIKNLYVSGQFILFAKYYAEFDPISLSPDPANPEYQYLDSDGNPRDSWRIPTYYTVDLHAGYRFNMKKFRLELRGSVFNLLDQNYITDAQNNDSYSTSTSNFDAASAGVFFGTGRTFNVSLTLTY